MEKSLALNYIELKSGINIPHIIKYMGSKRNILDSVVSAINDCYTGYDVVDLFAGTAVLSCVLRDQTNVVSNDIQNYSKVLANTYLGSYDWSRHPSLLDDVISDAELHVESLKSKHPSLYFNYEKKIDLIQFNELEKSQQMLINFDFEGLDFYLFTKYYSGTYWSYEQCLWIDALRKSIDKYKDTVYFNPLLSSLMFSMSYNSQSTGHYAQYRVAKNEASMKDILIYRNKEILPFFKRKFLELQSSFASHSFNHKATSLDYLKCLDQIQPYSTIYADPPYCFVHYSRFYHALETLVLYDYPEVKHKGRYRIDRHQSPFSIKTQVSTAFELMFKSIKAKKSNLVLSYSNTGMIDLESLIKLANKIFNKKYEVTVRYQNYSHSTMGRLKDKSRDVQECLIIVKML